MSMAAGWNKLSDKVRFMIVGSFNGALTYLIYILACRLCGEHHYRFALFLSWFLSSLPSYVTQKLFVFNTQGNWLAEYFKCCVTWLADYVINALLLEALVCRWNNVYLTQLVAMTVAGVFTYFMFKLVAFRTKEEKGQL